MGNIFSDMNTVTGTWKRDAFGSYKVFIGRKEELPVGTKVAVEARSREVTHVIITGTCSKCGSGYLYYYRKVTTSTPLQLPPVKPEEVSLAELNEALGL